MCRRLTRGLLTAATCGLALALPAIAQERGPGWPEPEPPKNLQLLPADTDRQELERIMREFALALGVGCGHCHKVSREVRDFASDDKPTKATARAMMRLVGQINQTLRDQAGAEPTVGVQCVTCHRGNTSPRTLRAVLLDAVERDGIDAALARYRELLDQYYGSGVYDFSEGSLRAVARDLEGRADGGEAQIEILRLNLAMYPESAVTRVQLAQALHRAGRDAEARLRLDEALKLDPEVRGARRLLEELTGGGAPPP